MNLPTWSDLNSDSIVPPLGTRKAPDLGPVGLMIACQPDIRQVRSHMTDPVERPFFNNTLITTPAADKGICVAGPYMGAPYGVMLLESLVARGVRQILVLGWCGAVDDDSLVGDIIIPQKAIVDEGTSQNYTQLDAEIPVTRPSKALSSKFKAYWNTTLTPVSDFEAKQKTIWTTDAIYRETPKKVDYFKSLGAQAVEMECSALFSSARFRQVDIAAMLVVSDSVASKDWKPGFRQKRFKKARQMACERIVHFAEALNAEKLNPEKSNQG